MCQRQRNPDHPDPRHPGAQKDHPMTTRTRTTTTTPTTTTTTPTTKAAKGKAAKAAKAAPAPVVTSTAAPAPVVVTVSTAHVHPRHRAYVMPGTNGRGASAGVIINAALATGATKADLCAILTAAKPANYAHNPKACLGKVDQHLAWLRKHGATFTMQDGGLLVSTDAQAVQAAYYNAKS